MRSTTGDLSKYAGLVGKTTQMFMGLCRLEAEDMHQELWIKVHEAVEAYRPARGESEEAWVYGCLANKVKDLRRTASRRARWGVTFVYMDEHWQESGTDYADRLIPHVEPFEVFGKIDEGVYVLPESVTAWEGDVLVLLALGYTRAEVALELECEESQVAAAAKALKQKLAELRPVSDVETMPETTTMPRRPARPRRRPRLPVAA